MSQAEFLCINKLAGCFLMLIWAHGERYRDLGRSGGTAKDIVVYATLQPMNRASGFLGWQTGISGVGSFFGLSGRTCLLFHVSWAALYCPIMCRLICRGFSSRYSWSGFCKWDAYWEGRGNPGFIV